MEISSLDLSALRRRLLEAAQLEVFSNPKETVDLTDAVTMR